jgi:hypothetical protein
MPALLTASSVMMCPHGGMVQATTANTRTRAAGDYVLRATDTFVITGCPFNVAGGLHPCVQVKWIVTAERSRVLADPVLHEESLGLCSAADQAVQGAVQIVFTQPRVRGV